MITATHLTKTRAGKPAVDDVTFSARAGQVTGLVGPNGAGKSTIMRLIVGLEAATSGLVTVDGHRYADFLAPLTHVGVLMDAGRVHHSRRAIDHLRIVAQTQGISRRRVQDVLAQVGLQQAARSRFGTFSLGMKQRLGIAAALLGDPGTLILDEPTNGLDQDGVRWIRGLCRTLADEGRCVLLSTHELDQMQQTADHVVVLGHGRIITDAPLADVLAHYASDHVLARTNDPHTLQALVRHLGGHSETTAPDTVRITGLTSDEIARAAHQGGVVLLELSAVATSLEAAVSEATSGSVDYRSS